MKYIVLIPSYEPDNRLIVLLENLSKNNLDIIVVNDGSDSRFDSIFSECNKYAVVLKHDVNRGKGAALKTGYKYVIDNYNNDYVIVTVDSDGQHSVIDTLNILDYASKNVDVLVLGKRVRNGKIPLRSRIGNGLTRFVYRITTGLDVYDTQTGLRAFSNKLVLFMLGIEGERFEYEMNVLLKCALNKIRIKEIEIKTIYIDNNSGSHFNPIKDSISIYKEIFKLLFKK